LAIARFSAAMSVRSGDDEQRLVPRIVKPGGERRAAPSLMSMKPTLEPW
jgi:hypothetical protein